jgi:putative transmembrane protein PGPGW
MFKQLKQYWSSLKRGKPGSRFQEQYDKQRKEQKSGTGRAIRIVAGFLLLPAGLFFLPAPGPGFLVLALGAVLIAREFRWAAKILDRLELRGRGVFDWAKRRWQQLVKARRAVSR